MNEKEFNPQVDQGTQLDSIDDIREYLSSHYTPTMAEPQLSEPPTPGGDSSLPFRPVTRPPMAILMVMDDGAQSGEMIRLRHDIFRIGREKGDFVVPHDPAISTEHVEIRRAFVEGEYRWYLQDLESTNGVFARVESGLLKPQTQVMFGRTRLAFQPPQQQTPDPSAQERTPTQAWSTVDNAEEMLFPQLRSPDGSDETLSFLLKKPSLLIGTDATRCDLVIPNDPFVSPVHAKIEQNDRQQWIVRRGKCRNGVWIKIRTLRIHTVGVFIIGEQKFAIKVS